MKNFLMWRVGTIRAWSWNFVWLAVFFGFLCRKYKDDTAADTMYYVFSTISITCMILVALLVIFQLLNPLFVKRGMKWTSFLVWLIAPTVLIAVIYNYKYIVNQTPEVFFWVVLSVVACGGIFTFKQVFNIK